MLSFVGIAVDRLDILKSWFDLVDEDGWVAREQILGSEARSKVRFVALLLAI